MKTVLTWLLGVAVAIASPVAAADPLVVKIATLAPEGSPWHDALRDLAEEWKRVSNGEIELRIYPGGNAGDESDVVRKMRIGQLQAAALTGVGLHAIAPDVLALQMPMMFRSNEELGYVRKRIAPKLEAILESHGFKVLNWADAGWVKFFSKTPVMTPEDLRSHKIFTWAGNPCSVDAWRESGYQSVPLAATDIYTGLQTGLITALPTAPIAALSYQWFSLTPHLTDLKWTPLIGATVVSTRTWNQIPDTYKAKLLMVSREAGERLQPRIPLLEAEAVRAMQEYGLIVHAVAPEIMIEWEKSAIAGYSKLTDCSVPADIVAQVERLRDEYRSKAQ